MIEEKMWIWVLPESARSADTLLRAMRRKGVLTASSKNKIQVLLVHKHFFEKNIVSD
jgi:hypothetical protein